MDGSAGRQKVTPPFELNANGGHGFFSEAGLYTFTATVTEELGKNPLHWTLTRNGENVPVSDYVAGELSADGGKI